MLGVPTLEDRMTWDYFIAHATADADRAEELLQYLSQPPAVRAFVDTKHLIPGDDWTRAIPKAQRSARATVALISPRADNAFYLGSELHTAIAWYRKEPDRHRLIPVLLAGTSRDPMEQLYGLVQLVPIEEAREGGLR